MSFTPILHNVAETIQVVIAPVFLLAGLGAILNVMVGRLARIIDRARNLEHLHPRSTGIEHERHVQELRLLDRRIRVINTAVFMVVSAAAVICAVVALLFIAELGNFQIGRLIAVAFILSMLLLTAGLLWFLYEVRLSVRAVRIRAELLERDR